MTKTTISPATMTDAELRKAHGALTFDAFCSPAGAAIRDEITARWNSVKRQYREGSRQLDGYRALIAVAKQHGMDHEWERLTDTFAELAGQLDSIITQATVLGLSEKSLGQ